MQPLNSLPKYNMFGTEEIDYKKAKVVVLPIPYDSTVTYKSGTRDGPRAIIDASRNMELYSYELGSDISKIGVYTMDELAPDLSSPQNMVKRISKEVGLIIDSGKVPLILGGEHTITIGAVDAFAKKNKNFSVVQLDAHADTRDEMFNTKYMHATAMARCSELAKNVVGVGIRSTDAPLDPKNKRAKSFFMEEVKRKGIEAVAKEVAKLTEKEIYLTIDADVFDPSEMPSVGTPEPDGLRFNDAMVLIKELAKSKKLLGFDIVELSPISGLHAPNYALAKLAYLTIGYFLLAKK
ncbi:MAG: agmatinase [Candidatus Micrarchaeales archaeon]